MRIALLVTGLGMGGAENQVVGLADRFIALGHNVLLISLTGRPVVLPASAAVDVKRLDMVKTPQGFFAAYRQARSLLRAFKPDIVHSHMVHANLFARLLRLTTDMPRLVCTAHNINEGGAMRMWGYRLTDWLADFTTNVSGAAVADYVRQRAAQPHKIYAVHNGIDCRKFRFDPAARVQLRKELAIPNDQQLLLAVGRLSEAKDYANLLDAFGKVLAKRDDCQLCIVGDGETKSYESQAQALGIAEQVRFLGLRRDVPQLLSAADVFVLSSAWEGLPLVIGEALACERVVVTTDAGGSREWLADDRYVVPVRNSDALASALLQALALTSAEKLAYGRTARDRILSLYSMDAVVARWLEIYNGQFPDSENMTRLSAP